MDAIERAISLSLLVYGVSHVVQRRMWNDLFQALARNPFGAYIIAIPSFGIGVLVVSFHNRWAWDLGLVTTLMGWGLVVKSTAYLVFPSLFTRVVPDEKQGPSRLLVVGVIMTLLGVVTTYDAWQAS
jgi:uncharacterized protein YjeT (DUF2065 family)